MDGLARACEGSRQLGSLLEYYLSLDVTIEIELQHGRVLGGKEFTGRYDTIRR